MAISILDSAFNTIILCLESKKLDCLDDTNSRKTNATVILESGWRGEWCVFLAGRGGSAEGQGQI